MSDRLGGGDEGFTAAKFALFVGIVMLVVAGTVVGGFAFDAPATRSVSDGPDPGQPPAEYAADSVNPDRFATGGEARLGDALSVGGGLSEPKTVVIAQASRTEQEDTRELRLALVRAGHEVTYANDDELTSALASADAYVRIDPGNELSDDQLEEVREFTDRGGRVLLAAEPNRKRISASLLSVSVTTRRTQMTRLAREYGLVFGNRFLYDTVRNDGNYRHVLASPTDAGPADADTVAMYTATAIDYRQGTVVLQTPDTTRKSADGAAQQWPVAVQTAGGNVLALGDTTFLTAGRHNVADNERFVSYIAAFLVGGEAEDGDGVDTPDDGPDTPDDEPDIPDVGTDTPDNGTENGTDNGTAALYAP